MHTTEKLVMIFWEFQQIFVNSQLELILTIRNSYKYTILVNTTNSTTCGTVVINQIVLIVLHNSVDDKENLKLMGFLEEKKFIHSFKKI